MPLTFPRTDYAPMTSWTIGPRRFDWGRRTYVMGIVNVTPDSFSDGGRHLDPRGAIAHAERLLSEGADLLDIGGESTRPGSEPVPADVELGRIIPIIKALSGCTVISVDTTKPEVARAALEAGAHMINDVSGLRHPAMRSILREYAVPAIAMHMQGKPSTMQEDPRYDDVVAAVRDYLLRAVASAKVEGLEQVMIDPGIGFGKTLEHNLALLRQLGKLRVQGAPLVLGTSRKGFLGVLLDLPPAERIEGTMATVSLAIAEGVDMVRVHDVKEAVRTVKVADAIVRGAARG